MAVGLGQEQLAKDMGEGMTKQKLRNAEKADNDPPNPHSPSKSLISLS